MRLRSSVDEGGITGATRRARNARDRQLLGEALGLTDEQQVQVIRHQSETGGLFGETAIELGFVGDDQLRRAIERQQGFSVLGSDDSRVDALVVAAFDPDDVLARTARNLRAMVTSARRKTGSPMRSVALIGLNAKVELPIVVANLAVACAQSGIPTLLIDAELDDPHQHALFRVRNQAGLSTLLSNDEQTGLIQPAAIDGLSLLPAGPSVRNAPELFDRQRLANTVELFVEIFELILVDAGCGATAVAATTGLDAAIILLRRDVTYTRDLRLLVSQLEASGLAVLGTVMVD